MTATIKLFDFVFDTTLHTAGERSMKTVEHDVSRDLQRFLDSAAIWMYLMILTLYLGYCAAVVLCAMMQLEKVSNKL